MEVNGTVRRYNDTIPTLSSIRFERRSRISKYTYIGPWAHTVYAYIMCTDSYTVSKSYKQLFKVVIYKYGAGARK